MVAAPRPAISSGCLAYTETAPGLAVPSLPVRTVDLYGAVTPFSIRARSAGEFMGFGADQLEALVECVELVNTGRAVSGVPPGAQRRLTSLEDVIAFGRRHRVENLSAARASDVPRLLELRSRLDAAVAACQIGEEATAISDLNALLAETGAVPQIVAHDGRPPHIHVTRAAAPLADRIAAHSAMGFVELVVAGQSGRIGTCASPQVDAVFIDLAKDQS